VCRKRDLFYGKKEKAVRLVQDIFNDYRSNRNAVNYFISKCKTEEWFVEAKISEEKQLVTLVNIISVCNREKNNHVNTVENTKTIKEATSLLFGNKLNEDKNPMLEYMLSNSTDVITRMSMFS